MIIPIKQIVNKAKKGKYAVGAFNTSNLEITLAIVRAAVKLKSPVIIQTSESAIHYSNLKTLFNIITNVSNTIGKKVPIAIHLDHGKDMNVIKQCIDIKYPSVHIDASEESFVKNVSLTKKVVKMAHKKDIWVQGELGAILGKEGMVNVKKGKLNIQDYFTDPIKAKEFVKKTNLDTLAISIGTAHGYFKNDNKLDYNRLKQISSLIKNPLVLHGGSGLSSTSYKKVIKNGISVINIDTNLRLAFKKALIKNVNKDSNMIDPRKILKPSTDAVQKEVEKTIKIFGSYNKV